MRRFYEEAERIWMGQGGAAFWLKFYHDLTQLELFPPEVCAELRVILGEAEKLAGSDREKERVRVVSEGFRVTELYSGIYHGAKELGQLGEELEAAEIEDRLRKILAMKVELEAFYGEVAMGDPLHRPTIRVEEKARFLPGMKLAEAVWRLREEGDTEERAELARELAAAFPESRADFVWRAEGPGTERLANGGFEEDAALMLVGEEDLESADYTPFGWQRWADEVNASASVLTERESRGGGYALRVEGAVRDILYQPFSVVGGNVYRLSAWAKGRVSAGSRVELMLYWFDEAGKRIPEDRLSLDQRLPGAADEWVRLSAWGKAPAEAVSGYAVLLVNNQAEGDVVYFDDIEVLEFAWEELE